MPARTRSISFALVIVLGIFLINTIWQLSSNDFIKVGEGMGWDGQLYGKLSQNLLVELKENGIPRNRIDRLLPVTLVYLSLRLTHGGVSFGTVEVVKRYRLANFIVLVLAICMLGAVAKKLSWSTEAFYIASASCFFNFGFLKIPFYYSTLTDNFALFISVASLLAYLSRQTVLLAILTILGAFSWSSILFTNFALLIFPYQSEVSYSSIPSNGRRLALGITILTLALLCKIENPFRYHWSDGKIHFDLVGIYFVFLAFYFFAWNSLLSFSFRPFIKQLNLAGGLLAVGIYALTKIINSFLAAEFGRPEFGVFRMKDILFSAILGNGIKNWGSFYVPHVVYFGPGILLMTIFWPDLVKAVHRMGLGFIAVLSLFLICSPDSESRHLIYGLPFFVVALGKCLTEKQISQKTTRFFIAFCLLTSRAWLPIGDALESRYFSNFGPWMVGSYYTLSLVLTVFIGVGCYLGIRRFRLNVLSESS